MTGTVIAMLSERVVVCVFDDTGIKMHEFLPVDAIKFAEDIMKAALSVAAGVPTKKTAAEFFKAMND